MSNIQDEVALIIIFTILFNIIVLLTLNLFSDDEEKTFKEELPVSFQGSNGKLKVVGEKLIFLTENELELFFAVERKNIADLIENDSILTVKTLYPVNDYLDYEGNFKFRIINEKAGNSAEWIRGFKNTFLFSRADNSPEIAL